jgi:hypothetical protein
MEKKGRLKGKQILLVAYPLLFTLTVVGWMNGGFGAVGQALNGIIFIFLELLGASSLLIYLALITVSQQRILAFLGLITLLVAPYLLMTSPPNPKANFFVMTGVRIPKNAKELRHYDSGPSFLGDGDEEESFYLTKEDFTDFLQKKPRGKDWVQGPISKLDEEFVLNEFAVKQGDSKVIDGKDIYFVRYDKYPERIPSGNYWLLIADTTTNRIVLLEHDS